MGRLGVGLLAVCLPLVARADSEAQGWLERMSRAVHVLNYEGTFIYLHQGRLQTIRIIHGSDDKGERERLFTLDGPSREVTRNNDRVACISSDKPAMTVERHGSKRPFPMSLPAGTDQLEHYYNIALKGRDRVAGLQAVSITVEPRDHLRYGYRIWLDESSALPLRSQLIDSEGRVVEQLMFTGLTVRKDVPPALDEPQAETGDGRWQRQSVSEGNDRPVDTGWRVTQLPAGFHEDARRWHVMTPGQIPMEHMVFSDGLATVSVFIEGKGQTSGPAIGGSHMGAVNAYSRIVDGHRVTVVGEVPAKTVKLIAESVSYEGNGAGQ